jgi:hypothetical protein
LKADVISVKIGAYSFLKKITMEENNMKDPKVVTTTFKMSPEQKAMIENLDTQIEAAEQAIEGLEEAGMDVSALKPEMQLARKRREALLKYFG